MQLINPTTPALHTHTLMTKFDISQKYPRCSASNRLRLSNMHFANKWRSSRHRGLGFGRVWALHFHYLIDRTLPRTQRTPVTTNPTHSQSGGASAVRLAWSASTLAWKTDWRRLLGKTSRAALNFPRPLSQDASLQINRLPFYPFLLPPQYTKSFAGTYLLTLLCQQKTQQTHSYQGLIVVVHNEE